VCLRFSIGLFILKTNIPCFGLIYRLSPDLPLDSLINPPCNPPNSAIQVSRIEGCSKPWDSDFVSMQFAEGNASTLTCNCVISRSKNGHSSFFINMLSVGHNNMCMYCELREEWPTMGNVWAFTVTGELQWHKHINSVSHLVENTSQTVMKLFQRMLFRLL